MTRAARGFVAVAALAALVAALVVIARPRPVDRGPGGTGTVARGAPHTASMAFESEPLVIRFGTPPADVQEIHGFERSRPDPAAERSAAIRRRAAIRLRWAAPARRAAVLDLEVPSQSPYRALRVLLNGHRVSRLELAPERRRYAFDLPEKRQLAGANELSFVFGALTDAAQRGDAPPDRGAAGRVFGLVVGAPSPLMEAVADAPLPFSAWAEGNDLVQAGPSRLAWALAPPAGGRLRFATSARHGEPTFRIEVESERGVRTEMWRGKSGRDATLDIDAPAEEVVRLWLHVDSADGMPAWGAWKDLAVEGAAASPPPATPPVLAASRARLAAANVVVVVLDAAGARHFGCYGHARPTTPNIDRIAAEGIVFDRAYTPAVFTRSAMASVWTSQLPDEHHSSVSYDEPLPTDVPTLAAIVSAAGIRTAGFVGNNMAGTAFGLDRGFSEFHRLSYRAEILREYLHGWLSGNTEGQYLAYVHYREPHYPFDPRPPFDTMFGPDAPLPAWVKTGSAWLDSVNDGTHLPTPEEVAHLERLYDGNLAIADHEIGLLRQRLESLGLWDKTVLVITADHGEALFEHGFVGHNEQVYEESVRIPLVLRFPPGTLPGGRRVSALTGLLDVAPTIADVLGIPPERTPTFRGRSLLHDAAGGTPPSREAVLVRTVGAQPRYARVAPRYKFLYNTRGGDEEMYDLARDPGERADILGTQPVRAAYCRQRLFAALLALPGRSGPAAAGWTVPADQVDALRALGYVQ